MIDKTKFENFVLCDILWALYGRVLKIKFIF